MMITEFIPQMQPLFGQEEKDALCSYMDEGGFLTEFKRTTDFEKSIASFTGAKHCIVVNNGTVSLTLAGISAGLKAGDEVIVPNYTMIATPNSQKLYGATPVFVDIEPDTLCIDFAKLEAAVTKKTKAIILVAANGRYPRDNINNFQDFAEAHNLVLIEDAAQALGSYFPDGRHIGTAGKVGSFSFSAPKIISTGQGGAIVTNDDLVAERARRLKDFGRASGGTDIHDSIGYNFKYTELQACVGLEQMKKLPERIERKKDIFQRYKSNLSKINGVKLIENDTKLTTPWFYEIITHRRDELQQFLKSSNIGTRVMYPPINRQKCYDSIGNYPISDMIGANGLWLPSSVQLEDMQIDYICKKIADFYA